MLDRNFGRTDWRYAQGGLRRAAGQGVGAALPGSPSGSAIETGPKGDRVETPSKPSKDRGKSPREPVSSRTGKEGKRPYVPRFLLDEGNKPRGESEDYTTWARLPKRADSATAGRGHWKQTDCWYYTPPGTKRRVPLFDEDGKRIRGKRKRQGRRLGPGADESRGQVAARRQNTGPCKRVEPGEGLLRSTSSTASRAWKRHDQPRPPREHGPSPQCVMWVLERSRLAGELKKGHVKVWIESHATWSPATRRNVIAIVLAAFNYAQAMHDVPSPTSQISSRRRSRVSTRLTPGTRNCSSALRTSVFGIFSSSPFRTGLRPFCELARLTGGEHMEETRAGDDVAGVFVEDQEHPQDSRQAGGGEVDSPAHANGPKGSGFRCSEIRRARRGSQ